MRGKGSAGGHNGMEKYHSALQSQDFSKSACRNRSKAAKDGFSRLCTQPFPGRRKKKAMEDGYKEAADAVCSLMNNGLEATMNHYNQKKTK